MLKIVVYQNYFTFYIFFSIITMVYRMKNILIKLIKIYQKIPGNFHNNCKFIPTCSNYGIEAIEVYGSARGSLLTLKRIIKCNPFHKGGYDPVLRRDAK